MAQKSKTEAALEEAERAHANDPERADLIGRARRFKASWVELGEALAAARRDGRWKRWGHASFEDYAQKELHLRRETAEKLTASFLFLQHRAPEVLRRDGVGEAIPSYQSVDFLRRAEAQDGAPEATVAEIRKRVIDDAAPLPALQRQYREVVFPLGDAERKARDGQSIRAAATRLRELLGPARAVPKRLKDELGEILDQLIETLGGQEEDAA